MYIAAGKSRNRCAFGGLEWSGFARVRDRLRAVGVGSLIGRGLRGIGAAQRLLFVCGIARPLRLENARAAAAANADVAGLSLPFHTNKLT
jgi:hypothetical protein